MQGIASSAVKNMRILFTTAKENSPSTELSLGLLKGLGRIPGVRFDTFNRNYADYDAVIFMGYDPEINAVRAKNGKAKVGVMDPRPSFKVQPEGADFILAHGVEMEDWYLSLTPNIFRYYIYPEFIGKELRKHQDTGRIILAYHGNKKHLEEMAPRVTKAISALSAVVPVEFRVMYDLAGLGRWTPDFPDNVTLSLIQWAPENYDKYIASSDIGIVPGFTSYRDNAVDYLPVYKITSNPGRILVFGNYGIPVVADMFPSALQIIEDGVSGYVCCSTHSWSDRLVRLARSSNLRTNMGYALNERFGKVAAADVLNRGLVKFIEEL